MFVSFSLYHLYFVNTGKGFAVRNVSINSNLCEDLYFHLF